MIFVGVVVLSEYRGGKICKQCEEGKHRILRKILYKMVCFITYVDQGNQSTLLHFILGQVHIFGNREGIKIGGTKYF